jgi:hypothetical protein
MCFILTNHETSISSLGFTEPGQDAIVADKETTPGDVETLVNDIGLLVANHEADRGGPSLNERVECLTPQPSRSPCDGR